MIPMGGTAAVNHHKQRLRGKSRLSGLSFVGGKKKNADQRSNLNKLKTQSLRKMPEEFQFNPKVSEGFLESWLDFPVDRDNNLIVNSFVMWATWLIWTNRSMAGLDPGDTSIRSRIVSQISVLGTAAGLFLVIAIAGFLVPPELKHEEDKVWVDVFGCLMFAASVSLIFYIGVALTAFYPLVESLRDDIAFDAFENYQLRVGGYEVYLFFVGMNFVTLALVVAAKILYSDNAFYVMLGMMAVILSSVTYLSRQIFLALDPISSMHMGLSNDPEEHYRAELMSHFILRKIPNNIIDDGEVYNKAHESKKLEQTRKSMMNFTPLVADPPAEEDAPEGAVGPFSKKADIYAAIDGVLPSTQATAGVADPASLKLVDYDGEVHQEFQPQPSAVFSAASARSNRASTPMRDISVKGVAMQSMKDVFCGNATLFKAQGLSGADSAAAYEVIVKAGCASMQDLFCYLDEHKIHKACSCGADKEARAHDSECSSRSAGAWVKGLTDIKVPAFHAVKIIQALKADLK